MLGTSSLALDSTSPILFHVQQLFCLLLAF